jgi:hypothetical protein
MPQAHPEIQANDTGSWRSESIKRLPGQKPIEPDSGVNQVGHSSRPSQRQRIGTCRESELSRRVVRSPPHRLGHVGLGCHRSRLPEGLDDTQLEKLMFPPVPAPAGTRPLPDFSKVHQELKSNRSVTLQLLWEEYKESQPDGVNYSWFCDQYRDWARHLDVVLRQDHRAGEKMFVDHAGDTSTSSSRPAKPGPPISL